MKQYMLGATVGLLLITGLFSLVIGLLDSDAALSISGVAQLINTRICN